LFIITYIEKQCTFIDLSLSNRPLRSIVCHITPTKNDPVCSLLSGWATTTGRCLAPRLH